MKGTVAKLYVMQVKNGGIPEEGYHFLSRKERSMLKEAGGRFFLLPKYRKMITVVLAGGVFDILHIGHLYTLNEAKKRGDVLIVAVAQDRHIENKKRKKIHSQDYRMAMVEFLKPVDAALLGLDKPEDMLALVGPDVIVYGYDQKEFLQPEGVEIVKLERHVEEGKFKTSRILTELGL
ncbi:MAG: adenylyltransferase/cytidyltransferase family protein [Candidatus Micrarchaeota archaeon]